MYDTMTLTKAVAALCGSLLALLLLGWAAEGIYAAGHGGHGEEQQAYKIDTGDSGESTAAAQEVSFTDVFATADASAGEKVFNQCKACHKVDGTNSTGPHLDGVVGRPVASVADFTYDDALHGLGGDWTPDRLNEFLANPKGYAPGTKMTFAGLKKIQDRANVIAYLQSLGG